MGRQCTRPPWSLDKAKKGQVVSSNALCGMVWRSVGERYEFGLYIPGSSSGLGSNCMPLAKVSSFLEARTAFPNQEMLERILTWSGVSFLYGVARLSLGKLLLPS